MFHGLEHWSNDHEQSSQRLIPLMGRNPWLATCHACVSTQIDQVSYGVDCRLKKTWTTCANFVHTRMNVLQNRYSMFSKLCQLDCTCWTWWLSMQHFGIIVKSWQGCTNAPSNRVPGKPTGLVGQSFSRAFAPWSASDIVSRFCN